MGGVLILHGDLECESDERLSARREKASKRLRELEREAERLAREMETAISNVRVLNGEIARRVKEGRAERGD